MPLFKFNFSNKSVDYCSLRLSVQPVFDFFAEEGPELAYIEFSIARPEFYLEIESSTAIVSFSITGPTFFVDILSEDADEGRLYLQIKKPSFLFRVSQLQFIDLDFVFPSFEFFALGYTQEELSVAFNLRQVNILFDINEAETNTINIRVPLVDISLELDNEEIVIEAKFVTPSILLYILMDTESLLEDSFVIKFEYFYWSFEDEKSVEGPINSDDVISFHNRG